jgi:hypothetical protein
VLFRRSIAALSIDGREIIQSLSYIQLSEIMILAQIFRTFGIFTLLAGIQLVSVSPSPAYAQIEPPPSSGTPSGTAGGGSRS